ncbi:long-chain fatty acid--CoA ligase [Afipia massiliensis]|uniref:Long-chain fatty acid--CoA ligase n=1 Tax=Afipia massiliensis TaxID=211460 RepID=A0A4U6BSK6_9BRAD|nr:AMP-binding protein [Afipia massiliensis]TKT73567.1 long-chain fatty acid--CoA ligase [Afipia massiliensis]
MSDRFPQLTLPQMLRENARRYPDRVAIRQKEFGIWNPSTWQRYYQRACHVGLGFRALGLNEGGHVAILSENRIEWVLAQLGANIVDGIAVGVYPTSPSNEVAYVLAHSESEIIVCEDQEQVDKVLERREELPKLRRIIVVETKGIRDYPPDQVMSFDALEALGADFEASPAALIDGIIDRQQLSQIGLIIYTSGSTGKPKGAMLSYKNIRAQAIGCADRLVVDQSASVLSYLPLCHVAEQMTTVMVPTYLASLVNFGESIRTVQEDLREVAPSMFLGVPRIWEKLHSSIHIKLLEAGRIRRAMFERAYAACEPFAEKNAADRTVSEKLKFVLSYWLVFRALQNFIGLRKTRIAMTGAAPISPAIVHFFRAIGVPLIEVYGLTESSGIALGQVLSDRRVGTVGSGIDRMETKLGQSNELLIRGDTVFEGYYRNEEATRMSIRDGWLHTGDVAEFKDGHFRIVDRLKDIMITAGGKNLSPSEIENTVKSSPFIKECIVIGEARKYVSALIQIDYDLAGKWAEEKGIAYTNFKNLTENESLRDLIQSEINTANAQLAQVSQIRKFHLLTKELDHDDDEVTATMKVRRSNVQKKYVSEIEGLYR